MLLILTGCISEKEAFGAIEWKMFLLIVGFSVISTSISNSGGGDLIANGFVKTGRRFRQPDSHLCGAVPAYVAHHTLYEQHRDGHAHGADRGAYRAGAGGEPGRHGDYGDRRRERLLCHAARLAVLYGAFAGCELQVQGTLSVRGLPYVLINMILTVAIVPLVWKF